jgi:hypothetical protein
LLEPIRRGIVRMAGRAVLMAQISKVKTEWINH